MIAESTSLLGTSFWRNYLNYNIYLLIELLSGFVRYFTLKAALDIFFYSRRDDEIFITKRKRLYKLFIMLFICFVFLTIVSFVKSNYLPDITIGDVESASQTTFAMFVTFLLFKIKKIEKDNVNKDNKDNKELQITTVV